MRYRNLVPLIVVGLVTPSMGKEAPTNIGVLTCTVVAQADGAAPNATCGFKPTGSGVEEKYSGRLRGGDQAIGTGKLVLIWAVLGPANDKHPPGLLAQKYVKAKAGSGQVALWVGQTNPALMLQFETNSASQPDIATGQLELKLAGTSA